METLSQFAKPDEICKICGEKIRDFQGYVPKIGEVCIKCYL